MNAWQQILSEVIDMVEEAVGVRIVPSLIDIPPDRTLGDIAIPCFSFAKDLGKSPNEIAEEWVEKLSRTPLPSPPPQGGRGSYLIDSVRVVGPYVNITLNTSAVAEMVFEFLDEVSKDGHVGRRKKVMIEYSQPNTHKEFHVGHLRNASLGAAIVELYRKQGFNVIAANYIGDVGAHVAKCLWALTKFHADENPPEGKEGAWLGEIYVEGFQKTDKDEAAKEESKAILRKLEDGDPELTVLWEKTKAWSMEQFERIYEDFGVHFDIYLNLDIISSPYLILDYNFHMNPNSSNEY